MVEDFPIERSKTDFPFWVADQWWGEIREARAVFFKKFVFAVPSKRVEWLSDGKRLKYFHGEEQETADSELSRTIQGLTDFYDKIGYFVVTGCIEFRDMLLPIWHSMRKTWITIKPFVDMERHVKEEYFDPTYLMGFEKLFEASGSIKETPLYGTLHHFYTKYCPQAPDDRRADISRLDACIVTLEQSFREAISAQNKQAREMAAHKQKPEWLLSILDHSLP